MLRRLSSRPVYRRAGPLCWKGSRHHIARCGGARPSREGGGFGELSAARVCMAGCTARHYGLDGYSNLQTLKYSPLIAFAPFPKSWIGKSSYLGSSTTTNLVSSFGRWVEFNILDLQRMGNPVFGTTSMAGVLARFGYRYVFVNGGSAMVTYDLTNILICAQNCYNEQVRTGEREGWLK